MGRPSERKGPRREGEAKAIEKRPNVSGKVLELRCIVGEQTVCLGGLRCGLMPAIGGGLPQLCVSRISGAGRRRGREVEEMEKVQTPSFWREGDVLPPKDETHGKKRASKKHKTATSTEPSFAWSKVNKEPFKLKVGRGLIPEWEGTGG